MDTMSPLPTHVSDVPGHGLDKDNTTVNVSPVNNERTTDSHGTKNDRKQEISALCITKEAWSRFSDKTSLHGIPHVGKAKGRAKAIFWLLVLLAMLTWLGYNIWTIYVNYHACTIVIRTSVNIHRKTAFPAVTFCNMNALKKDKVFENDILRKLLLREGNEEDDSSEEEKEITNKTAFRETSLKERVLMAMAEMSMDKKKALGYSVNDMVVTCTFSGHSCNISSDFVHTYNEIYGNCYSFNWQRAPSVTKQDDIWLMSTKTGPNYGLELIFNVQEYQYTKGQMDGVGMRIVVHSQNEMPFPTDEGISIPPGQLTYVGLKKKTMSRLQGRCAKCISDGQTKPHINMYGGIYGAGYTVNGCLKTCFQAYVMKTCGCANPGLPIPDNISNVDMDICDYGAVGSCFEKVQTDFYNDRIPCDCDLHPCFDTSYDQTFSAIPWPPVLHNSDIREMLRKRLSQEELNIMYPNNSRNSLNNNIRQHIAKLVIYYNDFTVQNSTEFLAYDSDQIWPDLGGIFGLYAGISFITLVELGEFILDLLISLLQEACKPK